MGWEWKMNRVALMSVGCVLAMAPSFASAAVKVNIADRTVGGGNPVIPSVLTESTVTVPVIFTGTDTENELLGGYDILFILEKVGTASGASFKEPYARRPTSNFVFGNVTGLVDFGIASANPAASPTTFLLNVLDNSAVNTVNVPETGPGLNAADLVLNVEGLSLGTYRIRMDVITSALSSADPNRPDPVITTDFSDVGTIEIVPEPTSLSLLAIGGLLALRRRRTA